MTSEPENHTIKLLQEMRAENAARFDTIDVHLTELRAQIGVLAQGLTGVRGDIGRIEPKYSGNCYRG